MPKIYNAHLRYNILDYCFRKKAFTFNELLDYLNERLRERGVDASVSTRTLRDDIKLFKDEVDGFGAPLPDNQRIYKYTDPNFSIAQRPLLTSEQSIVNAAQELLQRFENDPKYDRLAETLLQLEDDEFQNDETEQILFYDHNDEYKGVRLLKPLYLAIRKKHVLQVQYKGFKDDEARTFEFHPHVLKQYNRRWFVFGRNNDSDMDEWSIPLDERLESFEEISDKKFIDSKTDWSRYFRTQVGITRPLNTSIEKVVLKFYNGREAYFKTKPFHPDFEEFFEDDKQNQVWFETIINRELIQQLLSYGADVEVLEPLSLRNEMNAIIRTMQGKYQ